MDGLPAMAGQMELQSVCLFGEFFNANSAHNTRPYGADTLATSCQHRLVLVCGLCYSVCIPFVPAIRQQLQVLKKK